MVIEDLNDYHPGSSFWTSVPFLIPEHHFFTYVTAIETFSQLYVGCTLYFHRFACMLIPISVAVRQSVYEIFLANMLWAICCLVDSVCFHFYFHHNPFETNLHISQMNVLPFRKTSYYESDLPHYL